MTQKNNFSWNKSKKNGIPFNTKNKLLNNKICEMFNAEVKNEIIINSDVINSVKSELILNISDKNSFDSEITLNLSDDSDNNMFTVDVTESNTMRRENLFNNAESKSNRPLGHDETASLENQSHYISNGEITLISDPLPSLDEETKDKERIIVSSDPLTDMKDILLLEESSQNIVCSTLSSFQERFANFEVDTYTKYVINKTRGSFTSNDGLVLPKRVNWWKGGILNGVPYLVIATRYLSCRFGVPNHAKSLEKYNTDREKKHKLGLCKRYKKAQGTTKLGCPVKFIAHRVLIFPELQSLCECSKNKMKREEIRQKMEQSFQDNRYEDRFTCILPNVDNHKFHDLGPSDKELMDERILQKIKMLVNEGKTDADDITETLEDFAKRELNIKDKNRRRFFPSRNSILNAVNRARLKLRYSDDEQKKIKLMKHKWGDNSELFLRPIYDKGDIRKFLLVYQNQEMKRLFRLYGNNAVYLDAVHRTCEHVWPLYLLVVNTNVNYQVIGFFITYHENKQIIGEALELIKSWNPSVNPKYGIVNRPWEELKALEQVYPAIQIYLSSYHRNYAWEKKVSRKENNGIDRLDMLRKLKAVAEATTEAQINEANINLKGSNSYHYSSVQQYYANLWHFHLRRWAAAYWPTDLYFEINKGNERLKNDLNYDFLTRIKRKSLSIIIDLLIQKYIPQKIKFYKQENMKMNFNNSNFSSHQYFHGFSSWVTEYLLRLHFEVSQIFSQYLVKKTAETRYSVSIDVKNTVNKHADDKNIDIEVCIAPYASIASCTCPELNHTNFICKHIILVGLQYPHLHISKISSWLFRDPIFHLDDYFFEKLIEEPVLENEDFNFDVIDNKEEIKISTNRLSKDKSPKSECLSELKNLESLLNQLEENNLQRLGKRLKEIREIYSNSRAVAYEQETMLESENQESLRHDIEDYNEEMDER